MNKTIYMYMMLPMVINMLMLFTMMTPSKINKFHPVSLMMTLIILIFLICIKINFLKKSIISFMLFLIMIGGLMIIFMYITSLANNELFTLNMKLILMNLFKISPMILILMILMIYFKQMIFINLIESFQLPNIMKFNYNNLNIMYMEFNNKSSFFIMLYLYYSMICIMNICYKFKAPLRQLTF